MELSRKDALNIMNAFHACCVLERDLAVAIASLRYYKISACEFLGADEAAYADLCGKILSELSHKVSSACLSMTTRCSDAIIEGKKLEGKKDEGK